jgi:hypothetical protein
LAHLGNGDGFGDEHLREALERFAAEMTEIDREIFHELAETKRLLEENTSLMKANLSFLNDSTGRLERRIDEFRSDLIGKIRETIRQTL